MSDVTPESLAQRVIDFGLADRREVESAMGELGGDAGDGGVKAAIDVLQRRGLLTTLQAEKILKGDRTGYFYGDYKVLYLVGAGTFARVYHACGGGDVFAVKVLHKRFRDEPKELE